MLPHQTLAQFCPAFICSVPDLRSDIGRKKGCSTSVSFVPCWLVPLPGTSCSVFLLFQHVPFYVTSALFSPLFPVSDHIEVFFHLWTPIGLNVNVCMCVCSCVSACMTLHVYACACTTVCLSLLSCDSAHGAGSMVVSVLVSLCGRQPWYKSACVCLCAGLCLTCVCCSVNLCKSSLVLESVCWPSFLGASVSWLFILWMSVCVCVCACCFNSGGQAAANSSHEGAPRGAVRRIRRLMASPEQSPAHYQLGRSSCLSPGAACQVPCPPPYS